MEWFYPFLVLPLFLTIALALSILIYALRNRHAPGALSFAGLMLIIATWAFFYSLELVSSQLAVQLFWMKARFLVIALLPLGMLIFTIQFFGLQNQSLRRFVWIPALEGSIFIILLWTNDSHHWVWEQVRQVWLNQIVLIKVDFNWALYIHALFFYAVMITAAVTIYRTLVRSFTSYRSRALILGVCLLPPGLSSLILILQPASSLPINWTAYALVPACMGIVWSMIRFRFLDILPYAQQSLIESLDDGIVVLDLRGRIIYANQAAGDLLQQPTRALIGRPGSLVIPDWPAIEQTNHGRLLTIIARPHRRWFNVSITLVRELDQISLGKMICWHEITDAQQLVENSPNPIFSVSQDGTIRSWNRACETALLYPHDQIIGQSYRLFARSVPPQQLEQTIQDVFQTGKTFQEIEITCTCQDGSECYLSSRLYPLLNNSGQVEACVIANTNVTERRRNEQALQRQLKELSVLQAIATACVEADSENSLIETATRIIGDTFYPDNFGVFLLDEKAQLLRKHPTYRDYTGQAPESMPLGCGVVSIVIQEGRPLRIADVSREQSYFEVDSQTHSELCVPMRANNRVIGAINSESHASNAFSEDDERLLVTLAGQLSTAIERLRAEAMAHQRIQELLAISRISREIFSVLDRQEVLDSIVRHAAQTSGAAASGLFLNRGDERFYLVAAYGVSDAFIQQVNASGIVIGDGSSLSAAARTGSPIRYNDPSQMDDQQIQALAQLEGLCAALAVPMLRGQTIIGGILVWHRTVHHFTEEEEMFLQALAHQCINAVENARLFETEREQRKIAEVLRDTGSILSATLDVDGLLDTLLIQAERLVPYDAANFIFIENGVGRIARARGYEKYGVELDQAVRSLTLRVADTPNLRWMIEHQQSMMIPDTYHDPDWIFAINPYPFHSWVGALVISQDTVVALFSLESVTPNFYRPEHVQQLNMLASQASLALQNARLFKETQHQADRMALLAKLSEQLNQPLTVHDVISAIGHAAMVLADTDRGAIYLRATDNMAYCGWFSGISASYVMQVCQELQNVPGGQLLTRTEPILIADIASLGAGALLRQMAEAEGIHSLGLWPLVYQGQVMAAVGLYYNNPHEWGNRQYEILLAFSRQAAIALQNARLFEETLRRAAQQETLNHIIAAAASMPDLTELMETVLNLTMEVTGVEAGGIWLKGHSTLHKLPNTFPYTRLRSSGRGWSHIPMSLIIQDWEQVQPNDALYEFKPLMAKAGLRAMLIVPLLSSGMHTGEMALCTRQPRKWKPEEIALVETIGRQIGSAAERLDLLTKTQEQARQVQQIMDSVPEGVILLSAGYQILMANPAALQMLSILRQETLPDNPPLAQSLTGLAGQPIGDILAGASNDAWKEISVPTAPPCIFEVAARPLETGANASGWVLVLRDVTQERNNLARVQMQERLATVGQLAAGIAHDFNNIMAAVVVYADLLSLQPGLNSTSREQIAIIQQQTQRAIGLIRQILDFSRRSILEPHPLDILPFLKEFDKLLGHVLPENIGLRLVYQPGIYMVKADPVRLQQVLMNLALNARDAMPNGGTLQLILEKVGLSPNEPPPLPDLTPGNWIQVVVKDSGVGIAVEHLPHIFDPFFTTKPVGKGTGLGLAQVYGIIKQHGGCIDVHSQINQGTTFRLYLPELEYAQTVEKVLVPMSRLTPVEHPVLLVEDDQAARTAIQSLLESQGLSVLTASNGLQALKLYTRVAGKVALVISDLIMPEMGGAELYRNLQQQQPGIKFLIITGHPLDTQELVPLEEGRVHRLLKPFSVQDFIQTIQRLLAAPL